MRTNPTEFSKFIAFFKDLNPHLIPIVKLGKAPDPSMSFWKTARLSVEQAVHRLKEGMGNVGIVAEHGKFLIIDLDVKFYNDEGYPNGREKVLENLLSQFPKTLTVKTPSGGYHLYYLNYEDIPNFNFVDTYDPDSKKVIHMGEVRANARYVLTPGSYVKKTKNVNGERKVTLEGGYVVVRDVPLATIKLSDIPEKLIPSHIRPAQGETEAGAGDRPASPPKGGKFFNKWGWSLDDITFRQPKIAELLTQECPKGYDSPSDADEALATILYFWEFDEPTYERIMWAFRDREDPQRPGRRRFDRGKDYLKRTWERARKFIGDRTISKLLSENNMSPESWSPRFETIPIPVVELDKTGISLDISDPVDDEFITNWVERLPDGHFLKVYFQSLRKRSDTYPEYILTSGLFALSVALDGKVKIPLSTSRLQPNVFALLLGVSSYSRKTTTLFYLNSILEHSSLVFNKGSDDMSPEGLVSELTKNPNTYYVIDEFADLLTTMKKTWGSGLMDMFMKLYDGQSHKRRLRSKEYNIQTPYVSLIASTTPARLYSESGDGMIHSGFYPRFLIVAPQRRKDFKPISIDFELDSDFQMLGEYLDNIHSWVVKLNELYNQPVYAVFNDEGMDFINEMMMEVDKKLEGLQDIDKDVEATLWSRYHPYIIKIAVLLKFGEQTYLTKPQLNGGRDITSMLSAKPQIEVKKEYLEMAKQLVEKMYYPYAKQVIYDILLAIEKSSFNKVIRLLKKYKVIKRSDLLRRSHVTAREFREILDTLVQRGDIATDKNNGEIIVWVGGD
jgi:hypothetical protein